jgi:hypothetical protein
MNMTGIAIERGGLAIEFPNVEMQVLHTSGMQTEPGQRN